MRTFLCALGLIMMVLVLTQAQELSFSPPSYSVPGLMLYWQFNEGYGTVARDSSGHFNNGYYEDGDNWTRDARSGYAIEFDEDDNVVVDTTTFGIDICNEFSLSLWFKFPESFTGELIQRGAYCYPFKIYNYNNRLGTCIRLDLDTYYLTGDTELCANKWYNCVLTFKNGERKIYLNGKLDGCDSPPAGSLSMDYGHELVVGNGFTGIIDEVRLYNRAITPMEVAYLYYGVPYILTPKVVKVTAGYNHSVALKDDGRVIAWGSNQFGQCNVPPDLSGVKAIAAGANRHTLALKSDGCIVAWGDNVYGQCNIPFGLSGVKAIAAGGDHSVALKCDGTVIAWGKNNKGQCNVPPDLTDVVEIAAGYEHTVALTCEGSVIAWGDNSKGQCNVPHTLGAVKAIAAADKLTVALKCNGTVATWGDNFYGQCLVPYGLGDVAAITAGWGFVTALKCNGSLVAWGLDGNEQCSYPLGLRDVIDICSGYAHTVAIKKDGTMVVWGNNSDGQCNVPREPE